MLKHIGINVKSEEEIDLFYVDILGFEKAYDFSICKEYSKEIFKIGQEAKVFMLKKDDVLLEMFVYNHTYKPGYTHLCLEVSNMSKVLEKVKTNGYSQTVIKRDKGDLVFINDKSGNLFEIKEA